jgi:hypothetical protein
MKKLILLLIDPGLLILILKVRGSIGFPLKLINFIDDLLDSHAEYLLNNEDLYLTVAFYLP